MYTKIDDKITILSLAMVSSSLSGVLYYTIQGNREVCIAWLIYLTLVVACLSKLDDNIIILLYTIGLLPLDTSLDDDGPQAILNSVPPCTTGSHLVRRKYMHHHSTIMRVHLNMHGYCTLIIN